MAKKRAMLRAMNPPLPGTDATVLLTLSSMRTLTKVTLEIHEAAFAHEGSDATDQVIGTITGVSAPFQGGTTISFDPTSGCTKDIPQPDSSDPKRPRVIAFVIPKAGGNTAQSVWKFFPVPDDVTQENDADVRKRRNWFFYVKMTDPDTTESNRVQMSVIPHALGVGDKATYDWHAGTQVNLYVHGGAKTPAGGGNSAFEDLTAAISDAQTFIFISDWSFQPYFRVKRDGSPMNKQTVGSLLLEAATKRNVLVGIQAWQHPSSDTFNLGVPLDEHNNLAPQRLKALNGNQDLPPNLLWRGAYRTMSYSHHQKWVVLDCKAPSGDRRMLKAFFGGLDLTKGRWDWSQHIISPSENGAADFLRHQFVPLEGGDSLSYDDWYSAEFQSDSKSDRAMPREPWHDIYGSVLGATAWDVVREWIGRWDSPNSDDIGDKAMARSYFSTNPTDKTALVHKTYHLLHDRTKFVQQHEPPPSDDSFPWATQLLRSMVNDCWAGKLSTSQKDYEAWWNRYAADFTWSLGSSYERSIQDAYLNAIGLANEYIYIETQYFISSGNKWTPKDSNKIENGLADAICSRIEAKRGKKFHVYVVTPMYPEGTPNGGSGAAQTQRYYEWRTIQYMITRLGADWSKYLSFFFPARNALPLGGNGGYPAPGQLGKMTDIMFVDNDGKATVGDPNQDHLVSADTKTVLLPRRQRIQLNARYMVYVHSKLMLVDDTYAILGSANLNERSLAGNRDTEICVQMWPKYPGYVDKCKAYLTDFRNHLFQEHFGATTADPKSFGDTALKAAQKNYEDYARGIPIDASSRGLCLTLPFNLVDGVLQIKPLTGIAETSSEYLFDAENNDELWKWSSEKGGLAADVGDSPE